jgi:tripartite-type tricarboxylate transporter receptor subunit TctC
VAELPDLRERLTALGFTVAVSSPDEFKRAIAGYSERYGRIVSDIGLKGE